MITGPAPSFVGRTVEVPEMCREDAQNAADAGANLAAWRRANGWT